LRVAVSAGAGSAQLGRLVRSVDFERVLRMHARKISAHFAIHHVPGVPSAAGRTVSKPVREDLSTGGTIGTVPSVDDHPLGSPPPVRVHIPTLRPPKLWLGAVVPKRHARPAVTRTLLKRQIRAAVLAHVGAIPPGLWVVRLRAGFDRAAFRSAASVVLHRAARDELDRLLLRCAAPG
jgi:ribonuclease P protein component